MKGACLPKKSLALAEQVVTIDKSGIINKMVVMCGCFATSKADDEMERIDNQTNDEKTDAEYWNL